MNVLNILLQNGTGAFPEPLCHLYTDFIGHCMLDQRETSFGTAIFFNHISTFQYDVPLSIRYDP